MTSNTAVKVKNEKEVENDENIPPIEKKEPTNEEIVNRVFK